MHKTVLVFLVIAAACVAGNPTVGAKEWRWKSRLPTVSPNIKGLPIRKFNDTYTPGVRIPGTKTVEGCGQVKTHDRIVGGSEATPHSYPWQVVLKVNGDWVCGGFIINEEWVVTAAHCLEYANFVVVITGAHNIHIVEETQDVIVTQYFFQHENYGSYFLRNDLALVKLPEHLVWSDLVAPLCLPSRSASELPPGTLVTIAGWGLPTGSAAGPSDVLREVTVPVMNHAECKTIYEGTISHSVICTDSTGGHGTCLGDSGGAMLHVDGGVTYARGIASFMPAAGCESGDPDGFTRVQSYLDWIEYHTGIAIDD